MKRFDTVRGVKKYSYFFKC